MPVSRTGIVDDLAVAFFISKDFRVFDLASTSGRFNRPAAVHPNIIKATPTEKGRQIIPSRNPSVSRNWGLKNAKKKKDIPEVHSTSCKTRNRKLIISIFKKIIIF